METGNPVRLAFSLRQLTRQFSTFSFVGVIGTAVHYGVMALLVEVFSVHPVPGTVAGFATSAIVSYRLNYRLTFASRAEHRRTLPRFLIVGTIGVALNALLVGIFTELLHLHWLAAQVIATLVVLCWNFAANRIWTFGAELERRP